MSRAKSILYPSAPSALRLVACTHAVFACPHAAKLLEFQMLSRFVLGTWHRKKTSKGLVASAKRKRKIFSLRHVGVRQVFVDQVQRIALHPL